MQGDKMSNYNNCLWCSGEYVKERSTSLYCSTKCRVASNRANYTTPNIDATGGILLRNNGGVRVARVWKVNGRIAKIEEFDTVDYQW